MLLDGFNHVAVLTADTDRLIAFYTEMFGAKVDGEIRPNDGMRLTFLKIGTLAELNVFEIDGNSEAARQEAEVCVPNPDARSGVSNPPGTPAARYQ